MDSAPYGSQSVSTDADRSLSIQARSVLSIALRHNCPLEGGLKGETSMTKNQKWLKGLIGGKATRKTMARALTRGPDYRAQFTLEHDVKRRKLLKKRQDAERAAEAAAKAAKKGTK